MRDVVASGAVLLFTAGCLFAPAGTLAWPSAWALLAVYGVLTVAAFWWIDPELFRQRISVERGLKRWDPPLAGIGFLFLLPGAFIVAGLDVKRYGWSPPLAVAAQAVAWVLTVLGQLLGWWAMRVNRFFVKFVRIQRERGHHVVTAGPYAYVRHPGYAGGILSQLAAPVALGSLWAVIPAAIGAGLFVVRTVLEDRTLRAELPGYREYAETVTSRLIPGLW